jgi:hypothetical protein
MRKRGDTRVLTLGARTNVTVRRGLSGSWWSR